MACRRATLVAPRRSGASEGKETSGRLRLFYGALGAAKLARARAAITLGCRACTPGKPSTGIARPTCSRAEACWGEWRDTLAGLRAAPISWAESWPRRRAAPVAPWDRGEQSPHAPPCRPRQCRPTTSGLIDAGQCPTTPQRRQLRAQREPDASQEAPEVDLPPVGCVDGLAEGQPHPQATPATTRSHHRAARPRPRPSPACRRSGHRPRARSSIHRTATDPPGQSGTRPSGRARARARSRAARSRCARRTRRRGAGRRSRRGRIRIPRTVRARRPGPPRWSWQHHRIARPS